MRERARLLKFGPRDPAWLDGLESEMAEAGIAMRVSARRDGGTAQSRAGGPRGSRRVSVARSLRLTAKPIVLLPSMAKARAMALRARLARARIRDAEAGRTTFGPHLTDLAVRHTAKAHRRARMFDRRAEGAADLHRAGRRLGTGAGAATASRRCCCSTKSPRIWTLRRRAALFEEIVALGAQAWMTGTDLSLFAPMRASADIFEVARSAISPQA